MTENDVSSKPGFSLEVYDEVGYPGNSVPLSHPCHMAMVARLCGVEPPPPQSCRVLELGSGMGANLIPMAESLPNSEFVGVDLSARQIAAGQAILDELDLPNVQLRQMSIEDVDEGLGEFDYVIAHGVYSWVPHEIQAKILEIGRRQMAATGIQFVSYNTYPGWHLREAVRNMMLYHADAFELPQDKIQQARALVSFLAESSQSRLKVYPALLKEELERIADRNDWYIFHDHLERINEPLYFHEFVKRVDTAGLRFLAESAIQGMSAELFGESTANLLGQLPLLRQEQYLDFLRARSFRSSLLCHQDVQPNYQISPQTLLSLDIRLVRPLEATPGEDSETIWRSSAQGQMSTRSVATAVLEHLHRNWPSWVPVSELVESALGYSFGSDQALPHQLLGQLLAMFAQQWVDLAKDPPEIVRQVTETPRCSPLARLQARHDGFATNRHHRHVKLDALSRFLLPRLDGTQTTGQLADSVAAAVKEGELTVTREGEAIEQFDPEMCAGHVRQKLGEIAVRAFLVA